MQIKIIILFIFLNVAFADDKTQLEKEMGVVDFNTLKDVLKKDELIPVIEEKKEVVKVIKEKRVIDDTNKFNYPSSEDAWKILTSVWLVKNATTLKWDTVKPDYGIEVNFKKLLETIGYYEKTFHIILIENPEVSHYGLPINKNEYLFILSIPFIRSLDLSKLEISLLLLEDIIRLENKYFESSIGELKWIGTNFKEIGFNEKNVNEALKKMSEAIFEKGFSFQQQFETTRKMDLILKSHPVFWDGYFKMLKKVDELVKSNDLFKSYLKMYPSPEMQLKWLQPNLK